MVDPRTRSFSVLTEKIVTVPTHPSAFYKLNIFDDQQVWTSKGKDWVQDVTSINIGAGGDGKYILLGADGNHVATGDGGNHVATDGNDLDAAGDPAENCHQVVARFHDVDVTVFPTIWNVPVISQSYTCSVELEKKLIEITLKTMFISWLEHRITNYKRSLDNR